MRDRALTLTIGIVITAFAGLAILALVLWLTMPINARELYPGQYAQVDPAERQWFKSQKSPSSGIPCCDIADGTYAEEDLREGHYWTQFTWRRCFHPNGSLIAPNMGPDLKCDDASSGWMEVPDAVVIHDPNRHGAPVVWWFVDDKKVWIRCYSPGAGL